MKESKVDLTDLSCLIIYYLFIKIRSKYKKLTSTASHMLTRELARGWISQVPSIQAPSINRWSPFPNALGSYGAIFPFWTISKIETSICSTSRWLRPTAQSPFSPVSQENTVPSEHHNLLLWLFRRALLCAGCKILVIRYDDLPHPFNVFYLLFFPSPILSFLLRLKSSS